MTKQKKKLLGILKNTYCRLKRSKINGVGVFAIRDIPKGAKLFTGVARPRWEKFKKNELKGLEPAVRKMIDDFLGMEDDGSIYLPMVGLEGMDISFYLNHSEKPSILARDTDVTTFYAARKIKRGEELTSDYRIYDARYQ